MFKPIIAIVTALALLVSPAPAQAKKDEFACVPDIGKKTPVILVHGFISGPDTWGKDARDDGSMLKKLTDSFGSNLHVEKFDWSAYSGDWVHDLNIGGKLAIRINCLATSSRQAGGIGKVIVVGHSMGGLATRFASGRTVRDRKVSDDLGLVVTIGTPNKGTLLANLGSVAEGGLYALMGRERYIRAVCDVELVISDVQRTFDGTDQCLKAINGLRFGSHELEELPQWASTIPVFAIAGNVQARVTFWRKEVFAQSTHTDLIVGLDSALWGMQRDDFGGGKAQYDCKGVTLTGFDGLFNYFDSDLDCWHSGLLRHQGVQNTVVERIRTYLGAAAGGNFVGTWSSHGVQTVFKAGGTGTRTWDYGVCNGKPQCKAYAELTWKIQGKTLVYKVKSFEVKDADGRPPFDLGRDAELAGMTFTVYQERTGLLRVEMDDPAEDGIALTPRTTYLCGKGVSEQDRSARCGG